jgi:fumarate hydratase class I
MYEEENTKTNLPGQIEIGATEGDEYSFLFIAKGGVSENKTCLYRESKVILTKPHL